MSGSVKSSIEPCSGAPFGLLHHQGVYLVGGSAFGAYDRRRVHRVSSLVLTALGVRLVVPLPSRSAVRSGFDGKEPTRSLPNGGHMRNTRH